MREQDLFSSQYPETYQINPAELNVTPLDFTLIIELKGKDKKDKQIPIRMKVGDEPLIVEEDSEFKWTIFKVGYESVSKNVKVSSGFNLAQKIGNIKLKKIPEGVLYKGSPQWADHNLGASSPEEAGLFFVWGDTVGKESFDIAHLQTSKYLTEENDLHKQQGIIDNANCLTSEYDAVQIQIGEGWRLPKIEEITKLLEKCNFEIAEQNKTLGLLVIGKEEYQSHSLFLPFSGMYNHGEFHGKGSCGGIWSGNINEAGNAAKNLTYFETANAYDEMDALSGTAMNIRPVKDV